MDNFNPKGFFHTANDTWRLKEEYDKFIAENTHLAAPFHVKGLEDILPKRYPGELTVHYAKSHHGKSTALRNDAFKAQMRVEDTDYMVAVVSLEDSAETNASKWVLRYKGNKMNFQDDQMVFIGNSFGMSAKDMGSLSSENIIKTLEYGLESLPSKKGYSHILVDYAQLVPPNEDFLSEERRSQIKDTTLSLFHAAKQFKCPIDFASQALLKNQKGGHTSSMPIPGASDLKEASELYEIPAVAIAYWMPKHEPGTPVGSRIDDGGWGFEVKSNLIFVKVTKWRNAELMGFVGEKDVVGRVFPCWIEPDGDITYSADEHRRMYLPSIAESLAK